MAAGDKGNTTEPTARERKVGSGAEQKRKEDDEALGPEMVEVSSQTHQDTGKLLSFVTRYRRNSEFQLGCIRCKALLGTTRWRSSSSHCL